MNSVFLNNLYISYINLDNRKDRDLYIKKQFNHYKIEKYIRIPAYTKDNVKYKNNNLNTDMKIEDFATTYSHIYAIKNFLNNTNDEYCLILEDDVDLKNLDKIVFNFKEIFIRSKYNCIQLSITTREDIRPVFLPHKRSHWDFGCIAYILNRKYAQKIVEKYLPENILLLENFISKRYYEYRENIYKNSIPYNENIIYGEEPVLSWPIFSYKMFNSSLNNDNENIRQHIYTDNMFKKYWSKYKTIDIDKFL